MNTAIRGFGVGEAMRIDPQAVSALGHGLGSTVDVLGRALADTGDARFGPDSVSPDLREHGVAYAAGIRDIGAVVAAMAESVADLVDRLEAAATAVHSTDTDIGTGIRAAGGAS